MSTRRMPSKRPDVRRVGRMETRPDPTRLAIVVTVADDERAHRAKTEASNGQA